VTSIHSITAIGVIRQSANDVTQDRRKARNAVVESHVCTAFNGDKEKTREEKSTR